jgi:hypothetical protein
MNILTGGVAYLAIYGLAVYERIPISDWLMSHVPL